ncbi:MAG TPA: hypothetical protein VMF30_12935, partial [Pirellulales bacterium]|nr:hypothetical protein [Pirellulales bacterium]
MTSSPDHRPAELDAGKADADTEPAAVAAAPPRKGSSRLLRAGCVAYALLLVLAYGLLHWEADRSWWGTVLLFTPRWFCTLPLVVLSIEGWRRRERRWLAWLAVLVLLNGAVLGVEIPWRKLIFRPLPKQSLKILTLNCDYGRLKVEGLRQVIADFDPDLVVLQSI